jgi:hypothetical protein
MSCQEPNQLLVKSVKMLETEDGNQCGNRPFEDAQVQDDPPSMDVVLATLEKRKRRDDLFFDHFIKIRSCCLVEETGPMQSYNSYPLTV